MRVLFTVFLFSFSNTLFLDAQDLGLSINDIVVKGEIVIKDSTIFIELQIKNNTAKAIYIPKRSNSYIGSDNKLYVSIGCFFEYPHRFYNHGYLKFDSLSPGETMELDLFCSFKEGVFPISAGVSFDYTFGRKKWKKKILDQDFSILTEKYLKKFVNVQALFCLPSVSIKK